jgi:hypothetical protein
MKFKYNRVHEDSAWVYGQYGIYDYEAKVHDEPGDAGYQNGRTKKIFIYDDEDEIVGYDTEFYKGSWKHHLYKPLFEELEGLPKTTDSFYDKFKHRWGF